LSSGVCSNPDSNIPTEKSIYRKNKELSSCAAEKIKKFEMAEGTYEYELERAELLGIDPPDRATFEAQQAKKMAEMEQRENEELKVFFCWV
jgi:hypothetical protein